MTLVLDIDLIAPPSGTTYPYTTTSVGLWAEGSFSEQEEIDYYIRFLGEGNITTSGKGSIKFLEV